MQKANIQSNYLRTQTDSFFNYFVMQVFRHSDSKIKHAKLMFDKHGEKRIRNELRAYLSRELNNKSNDIFTDLKFVDSKENILIQLADMVVGCLAAYYKGQDKDLFDLIKPLIDNIWDFK